MASLDDPFAGRPIHPGQVVVDETVELEPVPALAVALHAWEFSFENPTALRGRAIAREGEEIAVSLLDRREYEHCRAGDRYWVEGQSDRGTSLGFGFEDVHGEKVLVVDAPIEVTPVPRVTVHVWRTSLFW